MPKRRTSFPHATLQAGANSLLALLEEFHALNQHVQMNGDLRKIVADAWLYLGTLDEQGVSPEGMSGWHRHFVQQARELARRQRQSSWSEEENRRFLSMLRSAADSPATLRPMDVGRVFDNARMRRAPEEPLRQWLLMQPDLSPETRRVLETGLYHGQKAF